MATIVLRSIKNAPLTNTEVDTNFTNLNTELGQKLVAGDATSTNTASKLVQRDASGNFSAGTITATLTGDVTGNVTGNVTGSSGSCTGNAATATNANSANAKWTSAAVAGSTTSGGVVSAEFRNNGGTGDANVAAIAFHCTGSYAIHMHLRADGYFGLGGWSRGAWSWYSDPSGNMVAAGNVTAYSDEKLKKNWRSLPIDFISELANVKHGIYDRIDEDITQVGVSAQSLQKVMPEAVVMGLNDTLTVSYGNAALVSAVELAKRVVEQDAKIARLEQLVAKLIEG